MSAALATLLKSWAVPRTNANLIQGVVFVGNKASLRVFEKNGFTLQETIENCVEVRGEQKGLHLLKWDRSEAYWNHGTTVV